MTPQRLDQPRLIDAVHTLAAIDSDLAGIVDRHGPPPLWERQPGFETLVRIILEQQVSLASAVSAQHRLVRAAGAIDVDATTHAYITLASDASALDEFGAAAESPDVNVVRPGPQAIA